MFFLNIVKRLTTTDRQRCNHQTPLRSLNPNTVAWIWLNAHHTVWKGYKTRRIHSKVGHGVRVYVSRISGMTKKKQNAQQTKKKPTLQNLRRAEPKRNQQRCDVLSASFACSANYRSKIARRTTRKAARNLVQKSPARSCSNNNAPDAVKLDIRRSTAKASTG